MRYVWYNYYVEMPEGQELAPYDTSLGKNQRKTADGHLLETLHMGAIPLLYKGPHFSKRSSLRAQYNIRFYLR